METQRVLLVDVSVVDENGGKHEAGKTPLTIIQNEKYGVLTITDLVLHVPSLSSGQSNRVILNQEAYIDILQSTAKRILGIQNTEIDNKHRKAGGVFYRHMIFFYMYHTTTLTNEAIATMFGKTHATVLHGKNRFTDLLASDKRTYEIAKMLADAMLELGYEQPRNIFDAEVAKMEILWK